jgi:hypothetical protein
MGVFSVRYKHHLPIKNEVLPVTRRASCEVRTLFKYIRNSLIASINSWKRFQTNFYFAIFYRNTASTRGLSCSYRKTVESELLAQIAESRVHDFSHIRTHALHSVVSSTKSHVFACLTSKTKQTPWPLARERTIPTERPPLVGEI